jgi:assimilatory nitrate reductase catalytic subunit
MHEMIRQMAAGEIRGLLGMCNNPFVSLPNQAVVRAGYEALEFHVQSDFFLSETAAGPTWSCPRPSGPRTRA